MTTANAIETTSITNVLFVPLEAVIADERRRRSSTSATAARVVKQEVETGAMNDNEIVVAQGLDEGRPRAAHAAGRQGRASRLQTLPGAEADAPAAAPATPRQAVTLPAPSPRRRSRRADAAPAPPAPATKA